MAQIDDFKAELSGGGYRASQFRVTITPPAGIAIGLPPKLSSQLAEMTVAGAGELAILAEESPTNLRQNVTSPGGTTAAALDILNGPNGMPDLLIRAVAAAAKRSKELSEE